ncbi:hypothetical protein [uncultured Hyphomicrobium sp.]|uniref:hypothetical protein n=1 Tax=uncultured Hyphomicrobium sp. TaxID=194373 RepID=UPI0025DA3522|nr:hypothetical protein [uncultured Hyphomicrobium sp.]
MASILEFKQPALHCRQMNGKTAGAAPADIVLFPGVRYERRTEAQPETAKPKRRARRRDHLELDD